MSLEKPTKLSDLDTYDGSVIVCNLLSWGGATTSDFLIKPCQFCKEDVVIAQSSILAVGGDPLMVCMPCISLTEHGNFAPPSEVQIQDIIKNTQNDPVPATRERVMKAWEVMNALMRKNL